jgi:dihydroxyacid dehydratase/phosphogluconate dehydratase
MATKKSKHPQIAVRLAPETRSAFINKSANYGGTSHVLRELVSAFVENRVTIEPPSLKGTIYEHRE